MDERTKFLICLGAANASNCIPCFKHYFGKAESMGISHDDIQEAANLASQVMGLDLDKGWFKGTLEEIREANAYAAT